MPKIDFVGKWFDRNLFDAVPMSTAVIDREYNLIYANPAFEQMFGKWKDQKCYAVYKSRNSVCPHCQGANGFRDGIARVNEEVGYNKEDQLTRYIKHTTPVVGEDGSIPFLIEMCFDITETDNMRREYQLLFDQVPCNVILINRDFRIVRTNARAREMLGSLEGEYCYRGLKGESHECSECTARVTFADGQMHEGRHSWKAINGDTIHQHVITVPLRLDDGTFETVMELAVDITKTIELEEGLRYANAFLETMINTSIDGVFAVDDAEEVTILNPSARRLFDLTGKPDVSWNELQALLPEGGLDQLAKGSESVFMPETEIKTANGDGLPVRFVGNQLRDGAKPLGMAFSVQDLSGIKKLENEKLEAERLAAVGQTVAGLAHGVKNLITALEGSMYMLNTGISKGRADRVKKGIDMLDRNIDRISVFVKAFLGFSKGHDIHAKLSNPSEIAQEVVDLYATKASGLGITLIHDVDGDIPPAPIDYESLHECLTNLVGNAIDACRVSEEGGTTVTVKTYERNDVITYEVVDDGCGMDYEVKRKVFTSFFTTKGLGGTGLGLLMTKKHIQEHGGTIDLETEPGVGTTFSIRLPRNRLPKVIDADNAASEATER